MERNINQTPKDFIPNGDYEYYETIYDNYMRFQMNMFVNKAIINTDSLMNSFNKLRASARITAKAMSESLNLQKINNE